MYNTQIYNLIKIINSIDEKIRKNINNQMTKVIILGATGCGKSSIKNCLMNNDVIIGKGRGNKIELIGKGIGSGIKSFTQEPNIEIDSSLQIIYCDCPGFEDTEGYYQEIVNSFVINNLFNNHQNCNSNKFKILLVVSATDIDSSRGQSVSQSLNRIQKMFPNPGELEKGIGIIITKGEEDLSGLDYIERLDENASNNTKYWTTFFKANNDHVFVFPKAKRSDLGKKYHFSDSYRLKQFILKNQMINPTHKIILSDPATLFIQNMKLNISQKVHDSIWRLFNEMMKNYQTHNESKPLNQWLIWMKHLKNKKFRNSNDLMEYFKSSFKDIKSYNTFLNDLIENEKIENFINLVLNIKNGNPLFQNYLATYSYQSIKELEQLKSKAEEKEKQERIRKEKELLLKEKERKIKEEQKRIQEMQQEIERRRIEMENNRRIIEEQERIQREKAEEIADLQAYEAYLIEIFDPFIYSHTYEDRKRTNITEDGTTKFGEWIKFNTRIIEEEYFYDTEIINTTNINDHKKKQHYADKRRTQIKENGIIKDYGNWIITKNRKVEEEELFKNIFISNLPPGPNGEIRKCYQRKRCIKSKDLNTNKITTSNWEDYAKIEEIITTEIEPRVIDITRKAKTKIEDGWNRAPGFVKPLMVIFPHVGIAAACDRCEIHLHDEVTTYYQDYKRKVTSYLPPVEKTKYSEWEKTGDAYCKTYKE